MAKTHTFLQKMVKLTDRVTETKELTDEMYKNYYKFINEPENKNSDLQKTFQKDNLYGSVVVRDLLNFNTHFLATSSDASVPGKDYHLHVEEWLQDKVCNHFQSRKSGLTCAKVAFYMSYSPCVECTKAIPKWCAAMSKAIADGKNIRKVFFVFNFREYYAPPYTGTHVHESNTKAREAYAAITQFDNENAWTETLTTHKGGQFAVPRINFRRIGDVKDVKDAYLYGKKVIGSASSGGSGSQGKQEESNNNNK